ncbi:MAG: hypothetical protein Alpg2KO_31970 [Alphaproteobacteria bacterium]
MSTEYMQAAAVLIFSNILFFVGLLFLSGKLFANRWSGFYERVSRWKRIAIFTVIISIPGNFLVTLGYRLVDVGVAGATSAAAAVIVMVTGAVLVDRVKLNPKLIAATLFAVASCASVAWLMAELKASIS